MKRFLIVDEIVENLHMIKGVLGELRINEVTTVETGEEGLALVESKRIECIITSWDCKRMPGKVFVQRLRAVPSQAHLPTIIYSQRIKGEEVRLLNELGKISVLPAPPDRALFSATIKKIIEADEKTTPEEREIRLAYTLYGTKNYNDSLKILEKYVENSNVAVEVSALMAGIFFEQGEIERAQIFVDKCLSIKPNHVMATQVKAKLIARSGNHGDAIKSLVDLLDRCPEMLSILDSLGHAYKEASQLDEAKSVFEKIKKVDPTSPSARDGLGEIAFREGDYDMATELLQESENVEDITRNLNNMGIALTAKQDYSKAIQCYTNAIKIFAKNKSVNLLFYNLGLAYHKSGNHESAFQTLAQCCLLDPKNSKAYGAFAKTTKALVEAGKSYDKNLLLQVKNAVKIDKAA